MYLSLIIPAYKEANRIAGSLEKVFAYFAEAPYEAEVIVVDDGSPDNSVELIREAFAKNPHMKVFVASGYYDLATPYFAARYTMNHIPLPTSANDQIVYRDYPSGHMMYILRECLDTLGDDARSFYQTSVNTSS